MEFFRQENWSGLPFPPLGTKPISPALQEDSLPLSHLGSPKPTLTFYFFFFKFSLLWLHRDSDHPFSYSLILSLKCSVTSVKIKAEFSSCWTLFTVTFVIVLSHFNSVCLFVTLWNRPPCSSVHGILQARIMKYIAMPFSRGSSRPND